MEKKCWLCINRPLVGVFLCVSPSLHQCQVPHPLTKSYFSVSVSSTHDRCVWKAVNFKVDSLIREEVWIPATAAGNLWGALVWVTAAGQATGIEGRYWVNCPCRRVCACLLLEHWWAGEQAQAVRAAQQPMGPILHHYQLGVCAQAVLQVVSSPFLQRAKLPPKGGPALQHVHHSPYSVPFPDLLWSFPSSSLRMILRCLALLSHHFFSENQGWDGVTQTTEVRAQRSSPPSSPSPEGLAQVVQHPVLFPSPQSLSFLKRRNQVPMGQTQIVLQTPSE